MINNYKKAITSFIFALLISVIFIISSFAVDSVVLRLATEDKSYANQGIEHYVSSDITVSATKGDGYNYGPITQSTIVTDVDNFDTSHTDFYSVPTRSVVTMHHSAQGYNDAADQVFISIGLDSMYNSNVAHWEETWPIGYFHTECDRFYGSDNHRWYQCTVEQAGLSNGYYYTRKNIGGTTRDLVIMTNKLSPEPVSCTDNDGDGYSLEGGTCGPVDCDDLDSGVNPGATEVCNSIDDDCDGIIDEGNVCGNMNNYDYYCDNDADMFISAVISGTCTAQSASCVPAGCSLSQGTDCDDTNANINPFAVEVCNGIDDDCDGLIDEDGVCSVNNYDYYCDMDSDNFYSMNVIGSCSGIDNSCIPSGCTETQGTDCNDNVYNINPGATEICNGIDDDCDGLIDEDGVCGSLNDYDYYCDVDSDSYTSSSISGTCTAYNDSCIPLGCTQTQGTDCNDNVYNINPGATEICNGVDDNCNGIIDEGCGQNQGIINVDLTPNYPRDNDDLSCNINVDYYNVGNITVNYEITDGFSSSGTYNCVNSNCVQDLIINNVYTNPLTYIKCRAWFVHDGVTYSDSEKVYISKELDDDDDSDKVKVTVGNARIMQTKPSEAGDTIYFKLGLITKANELNHARATLTVIGFGEFKRYSLGPFDLEDGDDIGDVIEIKIPENTKSGAYVARLVISDGNYRFVKHRVFYVK